MIERLRASLSAPKDPAGLVAFRVALGVIVSVSALRFIAYGWIDELFVQPTFCFKYWGFSWVRPMSGPGMVAVFVAMAALGACFAAGLFFRAVSVILFALFAYVQLIDVTNWLNHYYLVGLLLLLACFMPLGRAWSLDAMLFPRSRLDVFPAWCTYLLRFQVGVVYVNAGLAKATGDWLVHAQPLNIWLSARTGIAGPAAHLFDERATAYLFSWGGFLFDTTIVLFLLWRRTRMWAYAVVIAFHLITWLLFPIGMFPFIMVSAALVFMDAEWPRRLLKRPASPSSAGQRSRPARWQLAFAAAFCLLQVLVPLRHHLYGGNVLWHEQGMRFAWKVMVREKNGSIVYVASSKKASRTFYVNPRRYLTDRQERELSSQPDLVLQLAHHVADDFRAKGYDDVTVSADAVVSLNGRSAARMIDPDVDLSRVEDGLGKAAWILPEPGGPPIHLRPAWRARVASR
ncbi:MAG: HTTM domain-containing protein [Labilithrix sp.]|nr:HTTM domain-containing protein [Labilithrix sp.]